MSLTYKCNGCMKTYYNHIHENLILGGIPYCSLECFDLKNKLIIGKKVNVNGHVINNLPNAIKHNGMISNIPAGLYPPGMEPI